MRNSAKNSELLKLRCPEIVWKLDLYIGTPFDKSVWFNMRYTLFKTFK